VFASLALGAACVALLVAHRVVNAPREYRRVVQQGGTFFLGLNLMHAGYWMIQPFVRACAARGISPSVITWWSLLPAIAAAVASAAGHWGLAAWALLASALLDVMDGAVARATNSASPAGAVLDSVLDRYAEFIVFAGLLVYYHDDLPAQFIVLAAVLGSFLVSYSTAKAEALHLTPPRGSMKRSDRLTVLILGTALAPLSQYWFEAAPGFSAFPVLGATSLIALLANVSAIHRFAVLTRLAKGTPTPLKAAAPIVTPIRRRDAGTAVPAK
jgi:phosphatidylglycerophosphate synthase